MGSNTFMGANGKIYNHNGKEIQKSAGKNIRVSEAAWNKIRKFCFNKGIKMGKFTEEAALEIIKQSSKKAQPISQ